ncbi:MAG: hypothetical protein EOO38_15330, partial [Cytophagaceae bacterium]
MNLPNEPSLANEQTIYMAYKCDGRSQAITFAVLLSKIQATPALGWIIQVSGATTMAHCRIDSGSAPAAGFNQFVQVPNAMDGQWHVICLRISQSQARISAQIESGAAANKALLSPENGITTATPMVIGRNGGAAKMEVAGVVTFPVFHSDEEVKLNIDYLYRNLIIKGVVMGGNVFNGNFETPGTGVGTDILADWVESVGAGSVSLVPGEGGVGNALRVTQDIAGGGPTIQANNTPVTQGATYRVTIRARASRAGVGIDMGDNDLWFTLTTAYATYVGEFVSSNSRPYFKRRGGTAANEAWFEIDSYVLEEVVNPTYIIGRTLLNGGFESGTLGSVPSGWSASYGGSTLSSISSDDSDKYQGARSVRFVIGEPGYFISINQVVLTVNRFYRAIFWAKGTASNLIKVGNNNGTVFVRASTVWTKYVVDFQAQTTAFLLGNQQSNVAPWEFRIDELYLEEITS